MDAFLPYLGEFIGTAILILLGDGVVANVILKKTKGHGGGWIVITVGWATAVIVPALIFSGEKFTNHFNPALTIALALTGQIEFHLIFGYILAQFLGAFLGACIVWIMHKSHFEATALSAKQEDYVKACEGFCSIDEMRLLREQGKEEAEKKYLEQRVDSQATMLAVFCTGPAIRKESINFFCEVVATFVLMFALTAGLANAANDSTVAATTLWGVWAVILALGLSLGGTTGYSLNPARDMGPRIAHAVLPIKGKGTSDFAYSWVASIGPILGAILGAIVSCAVFDTFATIHW